MDDFLDQFLSSSPWSDVKAPERSSWIGNGLDHTNGLLLDTMGAYEEDEDNMTQNLIPSSLIVDNLITQKTSHFASEDSRFDLEKSLRSGESKPRQGGTGHGSKPSLLGVLDGNPKPSYLDMQSNTSSTLGTLNHDQPEISPVLVDPANSSSVQPESGSVGSNDSELSEIHPPIIDSHCRSSVPQLWPPSYRGVSSLLPVVGQDKPQGFGLQRQYVETDAAVLGSKYFNDTIQQGNLPASLPEQNEMNNHYMCSFAAGHQIPLGRTAEIHSQMQLSYLTGGNSIKHYADQSPIPQLPHTPNTASGGSNGAAKHRVRARRGQATDPHSIAERLRREKIAERMKNLQELVPNSNKTDKASMLDEIIDYVKFLQLQVKVLSMSRLGAAGAVVPLITDIRAEGSTGLHLSQSTGRGVNPFESPDDLAFEEEVVKLMESDMTTAMQFLQSKGLCFMPIALAAAISGSQASPSSVSADEKESILTNGRAHHNNCQPSVGTGQRCSDGENGLKDSMNGICRAEDIPTKGCDVTMIKREGVNSMLPIQEK